MAKKIKIGIPFAQKKKAAIAAGIGVKSGRIKSVINMRNKFQTYGSKNELFR